MYAHQLKKRLEEDLVITDNIELSYYKFSKLVNLTLANFIESAWKNKTQDFTD